MQFHTAEHHIKLLTLAHSHILINIKPTMEGDGWYRSILVGFITGFVAYIIGYFMRSSRGEDQTSTSNTLESKHQVNVTNNNIGHSQSTTKMSEQPKQFSKPSSAKTMKENDEGNGMLKTTTSTNQ